MKKIFDVSAFRFLCRLLFKKSASSFQFFDVSLNNNLTNEEVAFFAQHGFLVKRNAISSDFINNILDHKVESKNSNVDINCLSFAEAQAQVLSGNIPGTIIDRYGKIQFPLTSDGCDGYMQEFFSEDSVIFSTVQGLIGSQRMPKVPNINGLYYTFPCPTSPWVTPYIHTDTGADVVRFIIYLSDVPQGSGGFHVWPGSHLQLREIYLSEVDSEPNMSTYWKALYSMALKTPFIEIAASAGTVIFWHHRLAHAAGLNHSNSIRKVFIAGYSASDVKYRDSLKLPENPWEYWNIENN